MPRAALPRAAHIHVNVFSLGELTRSKSHPEIYNIPSHVHIENLKRVCVWLEALRARYNARYVLAGSEVLRGAGGQVPKVEVFGENFISRPAPEVISRPDPEEPIIITSGYRSAELNRKVGGVATSNHFLQKSLAKPIFLFTFATDISKRDKYAI